MRRRLYVVGLIFTSVLFCVIGYCLRGMFTDSSSVGEVIVDYSDDIISQVGHVDLSSIEALELLYEDTANDVTYYRRVDKSYVVEDETVYFNDDTEATVTGTDVYGFYTKRISSIVPGMSGTAVRNADGIVVGYVEQILNNNIYCIWK